MHPIQIIPPRSGISFILKQGERLKILDLEGEQVADFICYSEHDTAEYLSSGRTIDYAETIYLTVGHPFYSNRSNVMFNIIEDTVGRHDFLLTPCSADTFRIMYGYTNQHRGCFGNLSEALVPHNISPDQIHTSFNIFMYVAIDSDTGIIRVLAPQSKAGDYIIIEAAMDLIIGLTACSAEMSNNYSFKPIGYQVMNPGDVGDAAIDKTQH